MAGVLRKTMVYLGLMEQDDEDYDELLDGDDAEAPSVRRLNSEDNVPVRRYSGAESHGSLAVDTHRRQRHSDDVLARAEPEVPAYRIVTFTPANYNDAKEIGEQFRVHVPVIMNLTEMDDVNAKRLVDFAAGLTFGLHGSLEKVTNKVFLLSPSNVTVSAEDKARIRDGGFFNQS